MELFQWFSTDRSPPSPYGGNKELRLWPAFLSLLLAVLLCRPVFAIDPKGSLEVSSQPRHEYERSASISVFPLEFPGGTALTLIAPVSLSPLSRRLSDVLRSSHDRFSTLFGSIPSFSTSIRLMDPESFQITTGAPSWTNALYFRGQILIPVPESAGSDYENMARSVRHEYLHAVINSLSGGHCPGWLDEGLAQWAEGPENPALRPALARYLATKKPVPLSLLLGGFTRLERDMVAAAYAQSLIAAQAIIDTFGFLKIRRYLDALRENHDRPIAFLDAFDISENAFEKKLNVKLTHWSDSMAQARARMALDR